ncbi:MAG: hypothetical protein P4M11_01335 [Candidatus Pacebacteria bacterium]|nr:hypothetical protein [Candidatus Paceibacterota bacterium]
MKGPTRPYLVAGIVIVVILAVLGFLYATFHTKGTDAGGLSQFLAGLAQQRVATSTTTTAAPGAATSSTSVGVSADHQSSPSAAKEPAPYLYAVSPITGTSGLTVILSGLHFDSSVNYITFGAYDGQHSVNGLPDNVVKEEGSNDGRSLTFNIPYNEPNGVLCDSTGKNCHEMAAVVLKSGSYPITVTNRAGTSNTVYFNLTH